MGRKRNDKLEQQTWFNRQYCRWEIDYATNYSQHFSDAFELSEEEKRILDIEQENIELKMEIEWYKLLEKNKINSFFNL